LSIHHLSVAPSSPSVPEAGGEKRDSHRERLMLLSYVYGLMEHALQPFWVNSGFGKSDMPKGK